MPTIASTAGHYMAAMDVQGASASGAYLLIDLSDTTNFKHVYTDHIYLRKIRLSMEKASDGVYDIWFGVVTEVDATNGTVHFFHVQHLEANGNPTDSTDRFNIELDFTSGGNTDGLNLDIDDSTAGSEVPRYFLSNATQAGSTNWQNDVGLASPAGAGAGATGKPGAGDVVFYVEEVSDTGTIDFFVSADYTTL